MKNSEIARLFYEAANIFELNDVDWKPISYRKAARYLESMSEDVEDIYNRGGLKALNNIPGIGEHMALKIEEYLKTNHIKELENLKKQVPGELLKILEIPGMGPKKTKFLYEKLRIKTIKQLEEYAKKHKIAGLEHFQQKSEENIVKGIEIYKKGSGRTLLINALNQANGLISQLKSLKEVKQINCAGSLRRMKETIGDIDILITSSNPRKVMDFFVSMKDVSSVIAKGDTKSSVILRNGIQSDLRVLDDKSYGAAMQYFTGSKDHNIELRKIAIKKGYKLSEYGLFKNDKLIAGKTENEIYKKLGLRYIEPELRENAGELAAALNRKLPKLIGLKDIKGDLHMHTRHSDGNDSPENMALYAKKLGYEYICITDHSKSVSIANGMDEDRLLRYVHDLKKINIRGIKILVGSEVDILEDGSLDYSRDYLERLDYVVASIHSKFNLQKDKMTNRVLKAIYSGQINALGHLTTRQFGNRESLDMDYKKIFKAAAENNVFIEINSQPARMDISSQLVKDAISEGAKVVIDTDSHTSSSLKDFMPLGVSIARRGWCEKKDVANALPLRKFSKLIKK